MSKSNQSVNGFQIRTVKKDCRTIVNRFLGGFSENNEQNSLRFLITFWLGDDTASPIMSENFSKAFLSTCADFGLIFQLQI